MGTVVLRSRQCQGNYLTERLVGIQNSKPSLPPPKVRLESLAAVAENQPVNKHRMIKELSSFAARLREAFFFRPSPPGTRAVCISDRQFSELALELFALQFQLNPLYRRICEARQRTPGNVEHWTQIPFVPTAAFKELELSSIPLHERTAVFHSSGTTEQKPSRHFHSIESLAVYEASLWAWFARTFLGGTGDLPVPSGDPPDGTEKTLHTGQGSLLTTTPIPIPFGGSPSGGSASPARPRLLFLTPDPKAAPHSSLVHMFETVRQNLGAAGDAAGGSPFVGRLENDGAWGLDFAAVMAMLNHQPPCPIGQPLLILGTAFSLVHLLDFLAEKHLRLDLPPGSRVMETGGYKNRSRVLPKSELHSLITEKLGIVPEKIICEYGMSELSSQAYDNALQPPASSLQPRTFHLPPWARVQISSPETGREVTEGEPGLIRIFDLANVFSVAALQTEDLAIRRSEGFELIGREPLAEPRGCSLNSLETLRH